MQYPPYNKAFVGFILSYKLEIFQGGAIYSTFYLSPPTFSLFSTKPITIFFSKNSLKYRSNIITLLVDSIETYHFLSLNIHRILLNNIILLSLSVLSIDILYRILWKFEGRMICAIYFLCTDGLKLSPNNLAILKKGMAHLLFLSSYEPFRPAGKRMAIRTKCLLFYLICSFIPCELLRPLYRAMKWILDIALLSWSLERVTYMTSGGCNENWKLVNIFNLILMLDLT